MCLRRELESLIGSLNHACKVARPGRTFLRRTFFEEVIDLLLAAEPSYGRSSPNQHIWLNREFRADMAWWRLFVEQWNGVGLLQSVQLDSGSHI